MRKRPAFGSRKRDLTWPVIPGGQAMCRDSVAGVSVRRRLRRAGSRPCRRADPIAVVMRGAAVNDAGQRARRPTLLASPGPAGTPKQPPDRESVGGQACACLPCTTGVHVMTDASSYLQVYRPFKA
jgi:hypothetical protein